ncbi:hypothetical protein BGZ96_002694 [Linnemannia gamsii]|uniref:Uncharacterized protein n=1 Tax=Linnemannia gamsii TaxID=64522 RepID=A0ABQ7JK94_9FUNG|nr:hypothetical protein BGZ96_002694 [Linnemannia gamsii]
MTVTETSPPTSPHIAMASPKKTVTTTPRIVVRKPNPDDKTKTLKDIDERIAHLVPQLDVVKEAINALIQSGKKEADPRVELRKRLNELRDLQAANKKGKQGKIDKLNTLNASLKTKIADLKVIQDKLPFKTLELCESQISKLNKQVESGKLKLVDEKRTLAEISTLTKSKKSYNALQVHQRAIDTDKKSIVLLKASLDADSSNTLLSDEYNTLHAQVDEITKVKDEGWKKRNDLYDERTRLQRDLDAAFVQKRTVNDEYFAALRLHAKYIQDEQQRKREEVQQRKQAELEEKRLGSAREERELAEIPAFQAEITICDSVYKYLLQFSNDQNRVAAANAAAAAANNTTNGANANIRQVDTTANVPTGSMLAKKADKREEVFFVGGGCKSKKTTKAPKEKKSTDNNLPTSHITTTPTTTTVTLKFHLAIMEQLFELKVTVPRSPADLEKTLDALLEKSTILKANQASATAENKRKAEERIAKLTLADLDATATIMTMTTTSLEHAMERTEIVPEIQAIA